MPEAVTSKGILHRCSSSLVAQLSSPVGRSEGGLCDERLLLIRNEAFVVDVCEDGEGERAVM
jgi:hypothetical protein